MCSNRDKVGFWSGMISIAFWIVAQVPQLVINYQRKSADALSPFFVAEWLLGDTSNLVGALLQGDQPQTVVMTAQYFICMDVILLLQWVYYTSQARRRERIIVARRRRRHHHHHHHHHHENDPVERRRRYQKENETQEKHLKAHQISVEEAPEEIEASHSSPLTDQVSSSRMVSEREFSQKDTRLHTRHRERKQSKRNASLKIDKKAATGKLASFAVMGMLTTVAVSTTTSGQIRKMDEISLPEMEIAFDINSNPYGIPRKLLSKSYSGIDGREVLFDIGDDSVSNISMLYGKGSVHIHPSTLLSSTPMKAKIGTMIGYLSSVLYLNSRMAQIYCNWKRKSAEGLAISMFLCAVSANLFYGIGLLLRSQSWAQILSSLPWLIGSLGTMGLDAMILVQARWLYPSIENSTAKNLARGDEQQPLLVNPLDHDPHEAS